MKAEAFIFLTLMVLTSVAQASTETYVTTGTYWESNTYYYDKGDRGDGFLSIKPQFDHKSESETVGIDGNVGGSYNKYLTYTNQDYFDYFINAGVPFYPYGKVGGRVSFDFKKVSEPAVTDIIRYSDGSKKTAQRIERNEMVGGGELFWRVSPLSVIRINGTYKTELYALSSYQYLNNQAISGVLAYEYQFLPETLFYLNGSGGIQTYPNGKKNKATNPATPMVKYDSVFYAAGGGVRGRLAERTRIDLSGALLIRSYAYSSGFTEPVFNLKIEEQFSPKDLLLAGFDYQVFDSKFTNYRIDQTTYIAYARILGDQLLLLSRIGYTYSSFSKPNKRDDQEVTGTIKVDYSLANKTKLSWLINFDILDSDAINNFPADGQIDPAFSYEYFKTGVELTQYF